MSKFFRSRTSSGSDSSESTSSQSDHDDANDAEPIVQTGLSSLTLSAESSTTSLQHLTTDRQTSLNSDLAATGREWLLHSLLEDRCLQQVRQEHQGRSTSETLLHREARRRYQLLCSQLAPLDLVSAGLEDNRYANTRQSVRERLDNVETIGPSATSILQRIEPVQQSLPGPIRRLLTDAAVHSSFLPGSAPADPPSLFTNVANARNSLPSARYLTDFEELGLLGRGGYGEVFRARHRLDGRMYAVKKIPIRPHMVARIHAEGERVMEEILSEVRSLSRLEHPNVVRYFGSWIEWSTRSGLWNSSNELTTHTFDQSLNATSGADRTDSVGDSLQRVRTESDTAADDIGIVFEDITPSRNSGPAVSDSRLVGHSDGRSSRNPASIVSLPGRHLALHMQMGLYPMTLADFISPEPSGTGVAPLCHCFHLETSLRILSAILEGVQYLHSENVIHRDLKPANIFIKHESNPRSLHSCVDLFLCSACRAEGKAQPAKLSVCIGDFGLVANHVEMGVVSLSKSPVGTELYRPVSHPPQISPQLDIFAVGIIACELLHKFETQMERRQTLQGLRSGNFPKKFASCAGHQAARVKEVIAAMLSETEEVSIEDLKCRLGAIIASGGTSVGSDEVIRRGSA